MDKSQKNKREIEEHLEAMHKRLANAQEYIRRGVNVQGTSLLHFGDWKGQSGHPLWMKNVLIPATIKSIAIKEKTLDRIENKAKDKSVRLRKRQSE